jgi:hypothetical protein
MPYAYREDTGKKDQGRAFLDEVFALQVPKEDGPTGVVMITLVAGKDSETYKTASATLMSHRLEDTSMGPDCNDGPSNTPPPVQGCFNWSAPTDILTCWQKRSPSEGGLQGMKSGEGELPPPLPRLHPPPYCHPLRFGLGGSFLSPCARSHPGGTPSPPPLPPYP